MAPRRGGGGSSYGSSSGSSSQCSSVSAFSQVIAQIHIAFHAIFFLVYFILFWITVRTVSRNRKTVRAPLQWALLVVSILFSLLVATLNVIFLTLTQCYILDPVEGNRAYISIDWLSTLSYYLLIFAIMVPISRRLHQNNKGMGSLVFILHSVALAFLTLLLVVTLSYSTHATVKILERGSVRTLIDTIKHRRNLWMAYYVFQMLAMLLASGTILVALVRNSNFRRGTLLVWIPVLILSALAMTLLDMAGYAHNVYLHYAATSTYLRDSVTAQMFLRYAFYAFAFLGALVVGSSRQLVEDAYAPRVQPVAQYGASPVQPGYRPQQAH